MHITLVFNSVWYHANMIITILKKFIFTWVLFTAVSIVWGGEHFRKIAPDAGWVVQKFVDCVANKADYLKGEAESLQKRVKKWIDGKEDFAHKL